MKKLTERYRELLEEMKSQDGTVEELDEHKSIEQKWRALHENHTSVVAESPRHWLLLGNHGGCAALAKVSRLQAAGSPIEKVEV